MSKWAELTAMRVTTFSLTSLCRKAFLWQRRKRYLCEHRNPLYTALLFSGKLYAHLADIDHQAQEMFSQLIEQMATREEITEQLKAENRMEWVGKMNNIRNRAEEIIFNEYIYC